MILYIIGGIFFVWLSIITIVLLRTRAHYLNLVSNTKKTQINDILDELIRTGQVITKDIALIKKELKEEIQTSQLHLQKVGLLRFNPFDRIAGEQSFVVALMDNENSGMILNFIYTRDGLRVYAKKVKRGRGEEYELSEEEKKVMEKCNKK